MIFILINFIIINDMYIPILILATDIKSTTQPEKDRRQSIDIVPKCKYCWLSQTELKSPGILIKPCNCTNPVCNLCLQIQINTKQQTKCEICQAEYIFTREMNVKPFVIVAEATTIDMPINPPTQTRMNRLCRPRNFRNCIRNNYTCPVRSCTFNKFCAAFTAVIIIVFFLMQIYGVFK